MALRGILAVIFGVITHPQPGRGGERVGHRLSRSMRSPTEFSTSSWPGQLGRAGQRWGWYVFEGIATIAVGVIALAYPAVTLVALVLLVGIRAIAVGVFELVGAFSWEGGFLTDQAGHRIGLDGTSHWA